MRVARALDVSGTMTAPGNRRANKHSRNFAGGHVLSTRLMNSANDSTVEHLPTRK